MKKILFSLVALVCSMSMNAQQIKLMKGNTVVKIYTAEEVDNVVFEEAQPPITTGKASREGGDDVTWVQLWKDGPKFADYNVGKYYCWGGHKEQDDDRRYNSGGDVLSGDSDTAIYEWGSNWRMPTKAEFEALLANCNFEWTSDGCKFTGKKEPYKSNSLFFPAHGWAEGEEDPVADGELGYYWTSTPYNDKAYVLHFSGGGVNIETDRRSFGYAVRAVLAE